MGGIGIRDRKSRLVEVCAVPGSKRGIWGTRPSLANAKLEDRFQFERVSYFCLDPDSTPGNLVFNRTLPLKDSWAKIEKKSTCGGADAR